MRGNRIITGLVLFLGITLSGIEPLFSQSPEVGDEEKSDAFLLDEELFRDFNKNRDDSWFGRISFFIAIENYQTASFAANVPLGYWSNGEAVNEYSFILNKSISLAQALDLGDTTALHNLEKKPDVYPERVNQTLFIDAVQYSTLAQYYNEIAGKPLKAVGPAEKAADIFRILVNQDTTVVGPRMSLALHDFWKSHVLRGLAWTPFVADKRDESIATLYNIARGDSPYRVSAAIGLSWALIELDRPQEAAALADSMCTALGQSPRGLLEPAGKAYYLAERWELARARYDSLLTSLRNVSRMNLTREVGILHRLAHIAAAQKDWEGVVALADDALGLPLSEDQWDRKKDDRKRLEKLRKQARETLGR